MADEKPLETDPRPTAFLNVVQTRYARFDGRAVNPRYVAEVCKVRGLDGDLGEVHMQSGERFRTRYSYEETLRRLENP